MILQETLQSGEILALSPRISDPRRGIESRFLKPCQIPRHHSFSSTAMILATISDFFAGLMI